MKKIVLALVFVFVTGGALVNAKSFSSTVKSSVEVEEDFGCARDCVDYARGIVGIVQINEGIFDPNDEAVFDRLIDIFRGAQEYCYDKYCS